MAKDLKQMDVDVFVRGDGVASRLITLGRQDVSTKEDSLNVDTLEHLVTIDGKRVDVQVNTIADLASLNTTNLNGRMVSVGGATVLTDGMGGPYYYRSTGKSGVTIDGYEFVTGPGADDYYERVDKGLDSGVTTEYPTLATLQAATVPASTNLVRVLGYASSTDGGGQTYVRVGSEPSHTGKAQSNDGAWWEMAGTTINAGAFGALDGNTPSQNNIRLSNFATAVVALGIRGTIPPGTFNLDPSLGDANTVNGVAAILGEGQTADIEGAGRGKTILRFDDGIGETPAANYHVFHFRVDATSTNAKLARLRRLTIDANYAGLTPAASNEYEFRSALKVICSTGTSTLDRFEFEDIEILDPPADSIYVGPSAVGAPVLIQSGRISNIQEGQKATGSVRSIVLAGSAVKHLVIDDVHGEPGGAASNSIQLEYATTGMTEDRTIDITNSTVDHLDLSAGSEADGLLTIVNAVNVRTNQFCAIGYCTFNAANCDLKFNGGAYIFQRVNVVGGTVRIGTNGSGAVQGIVCDNSGTSDRKMRFTDLDMVIDDPAASFTSGPIFNVNNAATTDYVHEFNNVNMDPRAYISYYCYSGGTTIVRGGVVSGTNHALWVGNQDANFNTVFESYEADWSGCTNVLHLVTATPPEQTEIRFIGGRFPSTATGYSTSDAQLDTESFVYSSRRFEVAAKPTGGGILGDLAIVPGTMQMWRPALTHHTAASWTPWPLVNIQFGNADTTPSVGFGPGTYQHNDATPNIVTNYDDGVDGQLITVMAGSNTTLAHDPTKISLAYDADIEGPFALDLVLDATVWKERSLPNNVFSAPIVTVVDDDDHVVAQQDADGTIKRVTRAHFLNKARFTLNSDPTLALEAATKQYVDGSIANSAKPNVRVATTTSGTLSTDFENGDTVDGVTLATSDRILIKDQTAGEENGIYTVNASGAPTRSAGLDTDAEANAGANVFVTEGTTNTDTGWRLVTQAPITLGTTSLQFDPMPTTATAASAVSNTPAGDISGTNLQSVVNELDTEKVAKTVTLTGSTSVHINGSSTAKSFSATDFAFVVPTSGIATAMVADSAITALKQEDVGANTVICRPEGTTGSRSSIAIAANGMLGRVSTGNLVSMTPTQVRQQSRLPEQILVSGTFNFASGCLAIVPDTAGDFAVPSPTNYEFGGTGGGQIIVEPGAAGRTVSWTGNWLIMDDVQTLPTVRDLTGVYIITFIGSNLVAGGPKFYGKLSGPHG